MGKLIELSTEELLKKFGSGKHKPGSGSAAAFQGMLSAKLIHTVIDLTKSRETYKKWWTELCYDSWPIYSCRPAEGMDCCRHCPY